MKLKIASLIMTLTFFANSFSQNQTITKKIASNYSKEISVTLLNKEKYSTSEDVIIENNFATYVTNSSPFTGKYVEFQKDNVRFIKSFKNGIYDGSLYFFYDNGNLLKVINFKNGYEEGPEIEFYSNGNSKSSKIWKDGKIEGDSYEFTSDGTLSLSTQYLSNSKNGLEVKYSEKTIIEKLNYKSGKLNGTYTSFYLDGNLKASGSYNSDLRNGEWKWFYPDGTLKISETYTNGHIIDKILGYFPDGSTERVFNVVNGNGNFVQYYDNGGIKVKGSYSKYNPSGTWSFYNKDGNIVDENKY
ncbi:MAG: toxin-antitoxin system YwqK family antitoxin [Leptotrichiaceae bacterium]